MKSIISTIRRIVGAPFIITGYMILILGLILSFGYSNTRKTVHDLIYNGIINGNNW